MAACMAPGEDYVNTAYITEPEQARSTPRILHLEVTGPSGPIV